MKPLLFFAASVPWLILVTNPRPAPITVLIGGEFEGYLSPCGCVKPMQGGIRRMAGAVSAAREAGRTLVFINGPLSGGPGRQQELKAETLAEAARSMQVSGINLSPNDARLGVGVVSSIDRLSGDKLIASQLAPDNRVGAVQARAVGPFWVVGLSSAPDRIGQALEEPIMDGVSAIAEAQKRPVIALFDGDVEQARALARSQPRISLIVYRSSSQIPFKWERVGKTVLVSPGEKGKALASLRWENGAWQSYQPISLGPEIRDEPNVSRIYQFYLSRVDREDLLEQMPRKQGDPYAGTLLCASCHAKDYAIWKETQHAGALKTLEEDNHDRDPDCTGCHVVGLDTTTGFQSRKTTPDLADVGCESCHGPGKAHSLRPMEIKMPKIGRESCMQCHVPAHSPGFDYDTYWQRIAHGVEK